jgi:hypothetical protein
MSITPNPPPSHDDSVFIDLSRIEFPSDALSIQRLRVIAPGDFDVVTDPEPIEIANLFFGRSYWSEEGWLHDLNELLGFERVVAQEVFHRTRGDHVPFGEDDETREIIRRRYLEPARPALEQLYLRFRLADSPETARYLVVLIEQQAAAQALASLSQSR